MSTTALTALSAFVHQRWWHQWAIIYAVPVLYSFVGRLVALSSILDIVAPAAENTPRSKAAGVCLGLLQDLIVATLLVAALVVVELMGVALSRVAQSLIRDRHFTSLVLGYLGQLMRFLAALALAAVWFIFSAADVVLVCTHHIRLTTAFDRVPRDTNNDQRRHEVFYSIPVILIVSSISLLLAGLFAWTMDLVNGMSTACNSNSMETRATNHASMERTERSSSPIVTPTYRHTGFVVCEVSPNTDAGWDRSSPQSIDDGSMYIDHHMTIVSVTGEVNEYALPMAVGSLSLTQPIVSKRPPSLTRRHRAIAVGIAASVVFVGVTGGTFVIAKTASPVVAAIALNGTLNEIFRGVFGREFLPKIITR